MKKTASKSKDAKTKKPAVGKPAAKTNKPAAKKPAAKVKKSPPKAVKAVKTAKSKGQDDSFIVDGKLALPYTYFAGRVGSKFITTIRDEKKIMGVRCPKCDKVYVPPRQTCEKDMTDIRDNWVELKNSGTVTNYTVVRYKDKHLPKKPPYVMALIKLDGADTPFVHVVEGVKPDKVETGMRVQAVFAEKTTSTILDIDHFEPLKEEKLSLIHI